MIIRLLAAFFDKMLMSLGIQPAGKIPIRQRREYRGSDPKNPVLDPDLVYSWISTYEQEVANNPRQCMHVQEMYESQVQQYGYSLKNLRRVVPTKFLREFFMDDSTSSSSNEMQLRQQAAS